MKQPTDVYYPPHYYVLDAEGNTVCQVRDIQEHVCRDLDGMTAADMANAIKYLLRCPFKNDMLQDLYKTKWFVDAMIERREKEVSGG